MALRQFGDLSTHGPGTVGAQPGQNLSISWGIVRAQSGQKAQSGHSPGTAGAESVGAKSRHSPGTVGAKLKNKHMFLSPITEF